jgi:hypothetical protein
MRSNIHRAHVQVGVVPGAAAPLYGDEKAGSVPAQDVLSGPLAGRNIGDGEFYDLCCTAQPVPQHRRGVPVADVADPPAQGLQSVADGYSSRRAVGLMLARR